MKIGALLAIVAAVLMHAGFLLFGGWFFRSEKKDHGRLQEVELLDEAAADEKKEDAGKEPKVAESEAIETESEPPPDAAELVRNLELSAVADAPALEAMSLGSIEAALGGQAGAGDFAEALRFASGGRIGGTGSERSLDQTLEGAFNLAEIDQKPRAIFQTAPLYPAEMRGKKLEGVVRVIFVVDAAGRVGSPKVESANHPAFEKPAIDAVKQWKFEPAVKGGQRVACRMRVPIRFQPS